MSMVMDHHPACRTEIESWLAENHATFSFESHPLGDFNVEESLRNQARIGQSLNKQTATDYRVAMEKGDAFPAVIAYWKAKKLVIVDGNHRLDAHKESGASKIPVYVVTASPEIITKLTFAANVRNGLPTTHEERLIQAVHLIDMESTIKDAADALGLTTAAVQNAVTRTMADRRASTVGVRSWNKIPVTNRGRLGNIKTDEGFKAAAELVAITPVTTKEVNDLVTEINKFRSAASQVELVAKKKAEFRRRIDGTAGNTVRKPNLTGFARFMGALGTIDRLDILDVARSANLTTEVTEFQTYCLNQAERLMQIAEAIDEEEAKKAKRK
jgi:hypothetical protein